MQGCEAPTSQELLTPNPLDLILLRAVLEFAPLAWERGSVLPVQAQAAARGLQDPQRMLLPPPPEATPVRCEDQWAPVGFRVSSTSLDQASCPAYLPRAGLM